MSGPDVTRRSPSSAPVPPGWPRRSPPPSRGPVGHRGRRRPAAGRAVLAPPRRAGARTRPPTTWPRTASTTGASYARLRERFDALRGAGRITYVSGRPGLVRRTGRRGLAAAAEPRRRGRGAEPDADLPAEVVADGARALPGRLRPAAAGPGLGPARRAWRRAGSRRCSRATARWPVAGPWSPGRDRSCCRSPPGWPRPAPRCWASARRTPLTGWVRQLRRRRAVAGQGPRRGRLRPDACSPTASPTASARSSPRSTGRDAGRVGHHRPPRRRAAALVPGSERTVGGRPGRARLGLHPVARARDRRRRGHPGRRRRLAGRRGRRPAAQHRAAASTSPARRPASVGPRWRCRRASWPA